MDLRHTWINDYGRLFLESSTTITTMEGRHARKAPDFSGAWRKTAEKYPRPALGGGFAIAPGQRIAAAEVVGEK